MSVLLFWVVLQIGLITLKMEIVYYLKPISPHGVTTQNNIDILHCCGALISNIQKTTLA
jgi:hypothetical protein